MCDKETRPKELTKVVNSWNILFVQLQLRSILIITATTKKYKHYQTMHKGLVKEEYLMIIAR